MTNIPIISVITAVYNGATYLPDLIDSVLAQDYPHFEHIIIDDGSTDDGTTVAVLEKYAAKDSRIRWWTQENRGAYETQKIAMDAAGGDFIVMINADDKLATSDIFSIVVEYLRDHPECDLVYGQTLRMDEAGNILPQMELRWRPSKWLIRHLMYVQHCSMYISKRLISEQKIKLEPKLALAADWDWVIRLFDASNRIGYIKKPLAIFRLHYEQRSRKVKDELWLNERREIVKRHGGNYWLHRFLHKLMIYRGMTLIALQILRQKGIKAFFGRIIVWAKKRFAPYL